MSPQGFFAWVTAVPRAAWEGLLTARSGTFVNVVLAMFTTAALLAAAGFGRLADRRDRIAQARLNVAASAPLPYLAELAGPESPQSRFAFGYGIVFGEISTETAVHRCERVGRSWMALQRGPLWVGTMEDSTIRVDCRFPARPSDPDRTEWYLGTLQSAEDLGWAVVDPEHRTLYSRTRAFAVGGPNDRLIDVLRLILPAPASVASIDGADRRGDWPETAQ